MALQHARPGEVVRVQPQGGSVQEARTETLIKTDDLEVIRLAAPAGKAIPTHQVPGEITLQCLEGVVELACGDVNRRLAAGELTYLSGATPHAVRAIEDASVLLTILLQHKTTQA